jgi:hypothetical protein
MHVAIAKLITRTPHFEGPDPDQVEDMNILFRLCDGRRGWAKFLERHLQDFFLCSNGAWIEIERAARHPAARITSFHHLDSLRVWRTGDPETPAIYWDLRGTYHELKWWECINITDLEAPRAGWWYGGECAAERAYRDIRAVAAMTQFFDEAITGGGYTSIEFVPGITAKQILEAKKASSEELKSKGIVYMNGKLIIPIYGDVVQPGYSVQLKGLPQDWDRRMEDQLRLLRYAKALGIVPQDLDPQLTARGAMGVGKQAVILDENEKGYGSGTFEQKLLSAFNLMVLPSKVTMTLTATDLREDEQKGRNALTRSQELKAYVDARVLTPEAALYVAITRGDLPRELAQPKAPVQASLTVNQKPESNEPELHFDADLMHRSTPATQPDGQPAPTQGGARPSAAVAGRRPRSPDHVRRT